VVAYLLVSCAVLTSWSVQMLEFALMKEQEPVSGCLFAFDLRNSYFLVCSDARVAVICSRVATGAGVCCTGKEKRQSSH